MANKDMSLADRVQAMTFSGKLLGRTVPPSAKIVLARYRAQLRQAERYVVDDEVTQLCCRLCHEEDRLPSWSFLARLPHPTMWLQMNLHAKMAEFEKMNTTTHPFVANEVSPLIGYLLYHDGNSDTRWIAHNFIEFEGSVIPGLLAYVFDPEGDGTISGSIRWSSPTLSRRFPKIPLNVEIEDTGVTINTEVDPEAVLCGVLTTKNGLITSPDWYKQKAAVIADPVWDAIFDDKTRLAKIGNNQIQEERGALRYLVTMIAAINGIPREIRPINTRSGSYTTGMHTLPYLRHHNLTLTVPKDDRIVYAKNYLNREATGRKRAWHPVRGHWRVVEPGKAKGFCIHEPTMVESGLGMCAKCELMVRWITLPNGRGDPSVGVVDHNYRIAARKRGRARRDHDNDRNSAP